LIILLLIAIRSCESGRIPKMSIPGIPVFGRIRLSRFREAVQRLVTAVEHTVLASSKLVSGFAFPFHSVNFHVVLNITANFIYIQL